MSQRPVIALLTDFGLGDHYVGVMKGVIAGLCPDALTIDITHDVPPQDLRGAAFALSASWRYFPAGTVFVVVVDPGVGTRRRAIAACIGERFVVGPDNGVFDLLVAEQPVVHAVELTNPRYARSTISSTFEGRDRFAPAAAWLTLGTPLADLGPSVELAVQLGWREPLVLPDCVVGEVVDVDRFGTLVTNIDRRSWSALPDVSGVSLGGQPARLVRTYGEAADGEVIALFGSSERLEVAVARGSAAVRLGLGLGAEYTSRVARDTMRRLHGDGLRGEMPTARTPADRRRRTRGADPGVVDD